MSGVGRLDVRDLDVAGKRVLLRSELNTPLDGHGNITDDRRVVTAIPTIKLLSDRGAIVIVMAHLGRPKGQVVEGLRLDPVGQRMSELLGKSVRKLGDCVGDEVRTAVAEAQPGDVLLLENVRFQAGETKNDTDLAQALASLADVYVDDAFGCAHRVHASVVGVTEHLPQSAAGLLMGAEIEHLGGALDAPERPFVLIFGGAKISEKVPVLRNLLSKVDVALIGGGMAYTFLAANGVDVGSSRMEGDMLETARAIMAEAQEKGVRLLLPTDHVVAPRIEARASTQICYPGVPEGLLGLDIGPETAKRYVAEIEQANTVLWNGPMGVFEMQAFVAGTRAVGVAVARATDRGARTVVGGGDTASAAEAVGVADRMTHVCTGGGAALEFLEGRELPGVAALTPAG